MRAPLVFSGRDALAELERQAEPGYSTGVRVFFDTSPGGYAEKDEFLGTKVPAIRAVAGRSRISLADMSWLAVHVTNEARVLGWLLFLELWEGALDADLKGAIWKRAWDVRDGMWNWNVVDSAAPRLWGGEASRRGWDGTVEGPLLGSESVWHRRQGCVAFLHGAKASSEAAWKGFEGASGGLFSDNGPLMQRAFGWIAREFLKSGSAGAAEWALKNAGKFTTVAAGQIREFDKNGFSKEFVTLRKKSKLEDI